MTLTLSLIASLTWANDCRIGQKELTKIESDRSMNNVKDFLDNDTYSDDWSCIMLQRNLDRDSKKNCLPEISENGVFSDKIQGKIRYVGIVQEPYRYKLERNEQGEILVSVKIHFKGELGNDSEALKATDEKLAFAEKLWSEQSPDKKWKFQFTRVNSPEESDFSVKLISKNISTKFNSHWSIHDSKIIVAHEVGHMLGLDDEYTLWRTVAWQIINETDTRQCNLKSLMCDYYNSKPKLYPYYYYLILRRSEC